MARPILRPQLLPHHPKSVMSAAIAHHALRSNTSLITVCTLGCVAHARYLFLSSRSCCCENDQRLHCRPPTPPQRPQIAGVPRSAHRLFQHIFFGLMQPIVVRPKPERTGRTGHFCSAKSRQTSPLRRACGFCRQLLALAATWSPWGVLTFGAYVFHIYT